MNKIDIVDIKFIIMYKKINKMKKNESDRWIK